MSLEALRIILKNVSLNPLQQSEMNPLQDWSGTALDFAKLLGLADVLVMRESVTARTGKPGDM